MTPEDDSTADPTAANIRFWDALATAHGGEGDAYYDLDGLAGGRSSLSDVEDAAVQAAVGDVTGLAVLHVQCHLGMDAISLARRGAHVTGVDFSPEAVRRARELADRCGAAVEFVEGDSTALPESLRGRFDLAYATIGVLCWIEDVSAWMSSVGSALKPGGKLVLVDLHPLLQMVGSTDPLELDMPYAFSGAHRFEDELSYAGVSATGASHNVNYAHSLGEVVTAALGAGLRVDALHEHLDADFDPRGNILTREDDDRYRLRIGEQPLPLLFTLQATRDRGAGDPPGFAPHPEG